MLLSLCDLEDVTDSFTLSIFYIGCLVVIQQDFLAALLFLQRIKSSQRLQVAVINLRVVFFEVSALQTFWVLDKDADFVVQVSGQLINSNLVLDWKPFWKPLKVQ